MKDNLQIVKDKLHSFIKKYHTNELIKGLLLFLAIGLLYLIIIALLESFLWFTTGVRMYIFWFTVITEVILFVKFVLSPALQLFKLRKGLTELEASKVIGNHFNEINDKLLNLIQLSSNQESTELIEASIDQKSLELSPIPFKKAVDFKDGLKNLYYVLIPVSLVLLFVLTGKLNWFTDGYKRVVNYNTAYERPAPFEFRIINDSLVATDDSEFVLLVTTNGEIEPDKVFIETNGFKYAMQGKGNSIWQYTINDYERFVKGFNMVSGDVRSRDYQLKLLKTPKLVSLELFLDYPNYTGRKSEKISNSGNAEVLEGTVVKWVANTNQADKVFLKYKDTLEVLDGINDTFRSKKQLFNNFNYELITENKDLKKHEVLTYGIKVEKDQYPSLNVSVLRDTVLGENNFVNIRYSDDYGVSSLQLVYLDKTKPDELVKETLPFNKSEYDELIITFPGDRILKKNVEYQYYIQVTDNDAINGGKITKSDIYSTTLLSDAQKLSKGLQQQQKILGDITEVKEEIKRSTKNIKDFTKQQKQKNELNYNDRQKLKQALERQSSQQKLMKKFSKQLEENLNEISNPDDKIDELLKERLERQQQQMEENEKLMEELEKLSEKISNEQLTKKLEQIAKQQQNSERSLEQILELTKRYYVTSKADKLQKDIESLSKEQDSLANTNNAKEEVKKQEELSKEFENKKQELKELQEENDKLQKPMKLGIDNKLQEQITEDQKKAEDELNKESNSPSPDNKNQNNSNKEQKKAATKMKQLSQKMQQSMQSGSSDSMQEDAEMLRQILDNLVLFSFDQESLMNQINNRLSDNSYAKSLKDQKELRDLFKHVDDSLFALSLRRPEISDLINKEITDVYFNIDKALDRLAENRIYQGVASQQYILTASNNLADFLSNVLDNMQESLSGGSGKSSQDFQLPDIIQSQKELNEQMGKEGKKGKKQNGEGKKESGKPSNEKGEGKSSQGKDGKQQGQGYSEQMSESLFEMYKKQQQIKEALEKQLKDLDGTAAGTNARQALRQMERIEEELLERGVTERLQQLMRGLEYQLLKLEDAAKEQGKKEERESETSRKAYSNPIDRITPDVKEYFNQLEILNRQVLPLRRNYKGKVNEYFKGEN